MSVKYIVSSTARKELEESVDWYEEHASPGVAERFIEAVDDAIITISRNPEAYQKIRANFRHFVVDKFPFVIIYEILDEDGFINVLHIFHTSRHPKFKFRKK